MKRESAWGILAIILGLLILMAVTSGCAAKKPVTVPPPLINTPPVPCLPTNYGGCITGPLYAPMAEFKAPDITIQVGPRLIEAPDVLPDRNLSDPPLLEDIFFSDEEDEYVSTTRYIL